jgi:hypothetical protein
MLEWGTCEFPEHRTKLEAAEVSKHKVQGACAEHQIDVYVEGTYLGIDFRHEPLLRSGQQDLKAGLREVSISRQCPGKLEFAHQDKTGAIGERVRVVGMLTKEGLRGIKSRHTDPFDANRGALLHKIQYSARRCSSHYCHAAEFLLQKWKRWVRRSSTPSFAA